MTKSKKPGKQVVFEVRKNHSARERSASWLELLLGIRKVPVKVRTTDQK